jgi:hypothetical protein
VAPGVASRRRDLLPDPAFRTELEAAFGTPLIEAGWID